LLVRGNKNGVWEVFFAIHARKQAQHFSPRRSRAFFRYSCAFFRHSCAFFRHSREGGNPELRWK